LIFCNQWQEPQHYDRWTFDLDRDDVIASPDPFCGRSIPMMIGARQIDDDAYRSDADLMDALRRAPVITLTGAAKGPD
jgi:hypothetical protein